jgi:C-methyltransferase C-terminal domain/Methyltransferase domain/Putative zinc binding domain
MLHTKSSTGSVASRAKREARARVRLAADTQSSVVVDACQVCGSDDLESVLFVGYLPPVNGMPAIDTRPCEQPAYPAELLHCRTCRLVQLGLVVDPAILFPPSYPYTSGTTKILRDNFAELYREVRDRYRLQPGDLVVDIGSNDGTLLSNFHQAGHPVQGIEPTNAGKLANAAGIPTLMSFFNRSAAAAVTAQRGKARLVTAANVFAHIENVHEVVDCILDLLSDDGIFINESHYLASLLETVQYDTIYHEHLRYYSLTSLTYLLDMHGLEVIHARRIPTHGGSIRVHAARKGQRPVSDSVARLLAAEADLTSVTNLQAFRRRVGISKLALHALLCDIKMRGQRVYGVGAPSRASTLINYVGLDATIVDCVVEIQGSYKIGKYIPGTMIPVVEEARLVQDQPDYALLLSWHIADELMPKLTARGFTGKYIVPLPEPRVVG